MSKAWDWDGLVEQRAAKKIAKVQQACRVLVGWLEANGNQGMARKLVAAVPGMSTREKNPAKQSTCPKCGARCAPKSAQCGKCQSAEYEAARLARLKVVSAWLAAGESKSEIAKRLGVTVTTISNFIECTRVEQMRTFCFEAGRRGSRRRDLAEDIYEVVGDLPLGIPQNEIRDALCYLEKALAVFPPPPADPLTPH